MKKMKTLNVYINLSQMSHTFWHSLFFKLKNTFKKKLREKAYFSGIIFMIVIPVCVSPLIRE